MVAAGPNIPAQRAGKAGEGEPRGAQASPGEPRCLAGLYTLCSNQGVPAADYGEVTPELLLKRAKGDLI